MFLFFRFFKIFNYICEEYPLIFNGKRFFGVLERKSYYIFGLDNICIFRIYSPPNFITNYILLYLDCCSLVHLEAFSNDA
jgi:hypothetical protein